MGAKFRIHPTKIMLKNIAGIQTEGFIEDKEINNDHEEDNAKNEDETSTDSQPEKKEEVIPPSQEGGESKEDDNTPDDKKEDPLHMHPRFKQVIKERNEFRDNLSTLTDRFDKLEKSQTQPKQDEPIPEWFKNDIGDDIESWKIYKERLKEERNIIKKEIRDEDIISKQERDTNIKTGEQYCNNAIKDLQDAGHDFDDKEFKKFMYENPITSEDGKNLDFNKGIKLFMQLNTNRKDKTARKKIASQTMPVDNSGEAKTEAMTPSQLRGRSWSSLAGL